MHAAAAALAAVFDVVPTVTGLAATDVTTSSVSLAWDASTYNDSDPENTYHVYEQSAGGQWVYVANPGHTPAVSLSGILPGSTHTYAVTLLDADFSESPKSAPAIVTTLAPPTLYHPDPDRTDPRAAGGVSFSGG
jgi:fibronectin type 3 domain-containing protein